METAMPGSQVVEEKPRTLISTLRNTQANLDLGRESLGSLSRLVRGLLGTPHETTDEPPPPQPAAVQSNEFLANAQNLMEDSAVLQAEISKVLAYFRENYGS